MSPKTTEVATNRASLEHGSAMAGASRTPAPRLQLGAALHVLLPVVIVLVCGMTVGAVFDVLAEMRARSRLAGIAEQCRKAESTLLMYVVTGKPNYLRAYRGALEELSRLSASAEPDAPAALAELKQQVSRVLASARPLAPASSEQAVAEAAQWGAISERIPASEAAGAVELAVERLEEKRSWIPISTGTFALALFLYSWWPSRRMARSMSKFVEATRKIRDGSLDYRIELRAGGEWRAMADSFNEMAAALARAHRELEQSTQILQSILDNMADGVVLADPSGAVLLSNRAARDMLGGGAVVPAATDWCERYHLRAANGRRLRQPDQLPLVAAIKGKPVWGFEILVCDDAGKGGRYLIQAATPVRDEAGEVWGGVLVLTDITSRKIAEQALEESESKFRAFVETTSEWIWSVDKRGLLTYSNPAVENVLGYLPGQLRGMSLNELVHPDDRARLASCLEEIASNHHGIGGVVMRWVGDHGTVRWLESNIVPIADGAGQPAGYRGTGRDVTVRQLAEGRIESLNRELRRKIDQLNAVNQELESFSYSVSHDLRAPLRSIDGFSQALLEDYREQLDETGQDYLKRVRAASQRMAQLIDDLLNLSRVARNQISRSTVNVTELVEGVAAGLSHPGRSIEWVIHPDMAAHADRRLLLIVFENLLGNSVKFTRNQPAPRIEVAARLESGQKVFYVRDNGVGFDMAYADKLFGVFQRLHAASEFEGTGIGLATVQRIIIRHGGRIWAEAAVGEGAAFFFTLE